MPDPTDPDLARPDGRPAPWDAAAIDALSAVGRPQFAAAAALWEDHAPPAFRTMLGTFGRDGRPAFTFDAETQTYYAPHGRRVLPQAARSALTAFVTSVQFDFERRAAAMAAGAVPLAQWQARMADDLRSLYLAAAAFGAGGLARLSAQDLDDVRGEMPGWAGTGTAHLALFSAAGLGGLRTAIARLGRFAAQLVGNAVSPITGAVVDAVTGDGEDDADPLDVTRPPAEPTDAQRMTAKAVARRAGSYAPPAKGVAEEAARASHGRAGFDVERSILGPAEDHCYDTPHTEGCVGAAAAGWQPLGSLPTPGLRSCGPGCQCRMEYGRRVSPGAVAMSMAGGVDPGVMELGGWRMVPNAGGAGYHRVFFGDVDGQGANAAPAWKNPAVVGEAKAEANKKAHDAAHGPAASDKVKGKPIAEPTSAAAEETSAGHKPNWVVPVAVGNKNYIVMNADVDKLHVILSKATNTHVGYVAPDGTGGGAGDYARAKARLQTNLPMDMPRLYDAAINSDIGVGDGRHRLAATASLGIKTVPVVVPKKDLDAIWAKVGVGEKPTAGVGEPGGAAKPGPYAEDPEVVDAVANGPTSRSAEAAVKRPKSTVTPEAATLLKKHGITPDQVIDATVPDGKYFGNAHITLAASNGRGDDLFNVLAGDPDDPSAAYADRSVHINPTEGIFIQNKEIRLPHNARGSGEGTRYFAAQVEGARRLGAKEFHTAAARSEYYNGYNTWARLGYDGRLKHSIIDKLPEELKGADRVSDLMQTKGGQEFWREHGHSFAGRFDLDPNSQHSRALAAYLKEKAHA